MCGRVVGWCWKAAEGVLGVGRALGVGRTWSGAVRVRLDDT
jgi:hypothetical protein